MLIFFLSFCLLVIGLIVDVVDVAFMFVLFYVFVFLFCVVTVLVAVVATSYTAPSLLVNIRRISRILPITEYSSLYTPRQRTFANFYEPFQLLNIRQIPRTLSQDIYSQLELPSCICISCDLQLFKKAVHQDTSFMNLANSFDFALLVEV